MYEPKQNKKVIRVLTVIAYIFSVSLAAIMLSLYYMILWEPKQQDRGLQSQSSTHPPCGYHDGSLDEAPRVLPRLQDSTPPS